MRRSSKRRPQRDDVPRARGLSASSLVLAACVWAGAIDISGCGASAGTAGSGGSAGGSNDAAGGSLGGSAGASFGGSAGASLGGSPGFGGGGGAMPTATGGAAGRPPGGAGGGVGGASGTQGGSAGSPGSAGSAGSPGSAGSAGRGGSAGAGGKSAAAGTSGSNGNGGAGGSGDVVVDGWYEAEAVPPNVLTYAATVSHTDEGQNRTCPVDTRAGLSAVEAHGVTEGANCASAGGMVVNILGRSPCNPETPSSYTNCQNLGAGIEFHDVTVPANGTYDVTWWYHCGLDDHYGDTTCGGVHYPVGSSCRPHLIDVNGVPMSSAGTKYYQFPCYPTAWSYIHAATTALPLQAGANVIYIHAPGATTLDAVDVDAINVLPQGKGAPPLATPVMRGN